MDDAKNPRKKILSYKSLNAAVLKGGGILASYGFALVVTKLLGVEAFGRFSVWISALTIISGLALIGFDKAVLKLVSESFVKGDIQRIRRITSDSFVIVLVVGLALAILIGVCSVPIAEFLYGDKNQWIYIVLLAVAIPLIGLVTLSSQIIRGLDFTNLYVLLDHGFRYLIPLLLLVLFYALFEFNSVETIAFSLGLFLILLFSTLYLRINVGLRIDSTYDKLIDSFKLIYPLAIPLLIANVSVLIKGWSDTLILGILTDEESVGYYNVSLKIAKLIAIPLVANNAAIAVQVSRLLGDADPKDLKKFYWKTVTRLVVFSSAIGLGVLVFQRFILEQFDAYNSVTQSALYILIAAFIINSMAGPVGLILQLSNKQKTYRNLSVLTALVSVILNFILIPEFGIIGASIAALVVQVFWNLGGFVYANKLMRNNNA